ncbi:MAG TPA: hypothetical protein VIH27_00175 [Nitrososphaerales archaeon]
MDLTDEYIIKVLEDLTVRALAIHPFPSYGRIGSIKALSDLGIGWHTYGEVQRELCKYHKTGNVFIFDLSRSYPQIIEKDEKTNLIRIKPDAFRVISKHIDRYTKQILNAIQEAKAKSVDPNR